MKKVITYGTFDLFHYGHLNILKRAKQLGDYLIVGVTSESYDLERGKLNVKDSLITRIKNVRETGLADEIIIEEYQGQKIHDVLKYGVSTLVVGSDWIGKFDYLKKYCDVVYLERTKNISSTQLREQKNIYKIGLVVDKVYDNNMVLESKYVSGIHIEAVFSENIETAKEFSEKYELNFSTNEYEKFLSCVDIVCLNSKAMDKVKYAYYIEQAIEHGKYVIYEAANIGNYEILYNILEKAREKEVLICESTVLAYIKSFDQMVWRVKGGIIGEIISLNIKISRNNFYIGNNQKNNLMYLAFFAMLRIIGEESKRITKFVNEENKFESIYAITSNTETHINIGLDIDLEDSLEIIGSEGILYVPDEWWKMQYYKIRNKEHKKIARYCYNFEGTGFRYLLMDMISMLETGRKESCKVFPSELLKIAELINEIK